jgi:hypothetical protein
MRYFPETLLQLDEAKTHTANASIAGIFNIFILTRGINSAPGPKVLTSYLFSYPSIAPQCRAQLRKKAARERERERQRDRENLSARNKHGASRVINGVLAAHAMGCG